MSSTKLEYLNAPQVGPQGGGLLLRFLPALIRANSGRRDPGVARRRRREPTIPAGLPAAQALLTLEPPTPALRPRPRLERLAHGQENRALLCPYPEGTTKTCFPVFLSCLLSVLVSP